MWPFEAVSADSCDELFPSIILQAYKVFFSFIISLYDSYPYSNAAKMAMCTS